MFLKKLFRMNLSNVEMEESCPMLVLNMHFGLFEGSLI